MLADMLKKLVARFEAKNGNSGERAQITITTREGKMSHNCTSQGGKYSKKLTIPLSQPAALSDVLFMCLVFRSRPFDASFFIKV